MYTSHTRQSNACDSLARHSFVYQAALGIDEFTELLAEHEALSKLIDSLLAEG